MPAKRIRTIVQSSIVDSGLRAIGDLKYSKPAPDELQLDFYAYTCDPTERGFECGLRKYRAKYRKEVVGPVELDVDYQPKPPYPPLTREKVPPVRSAATSKDGETLLEWMQKPEVKEEEKEELILKFEVPVCEQATFAPKMECRMSKWKVTYKKGILGPIMVEVE